MSDEPRVRHALRRLRDTSREAAFLLAMFSAGGFGLAVFWERWLLAFAFAYSFHLFGLVRLVARTVPTGSKNAD